MLVSAQKVQYQSGSSAALFQVGGGAKMAREKIWSETKLDGNDLWREHKEIFADSTVLTFVLLDFKLDLENSIFLIICSFTDLG